MGGASRRRSRRFASDWAARGSGRKDGRTEGRKGGRTEGGRDGRRDRAESAERAQSVRRTPTESKRREQPSRIGWRLKVRQRARKTCRNSDLPFFRPQLIPSSPADLSPLRAAPRPVPFRFLRLIRWTQPSPVLLPVPPCSLHGSSLHHLCSLCCCIQFSFRLRAPAVPPSRHQSYATLGSTRAYSTSVTKLTSTKTTLRNRMLPWTAGRSLLSIAVST